MVKFYIENYGCQMNVSESDSLRNLLRENGHTEANNPRESDVVIINTCNVRKTAEERIEGRLGYYRSLITNEKIRLKVILMGCMAQNSGIQMKKKFPDVVGLLWGTYNKDGILEYMDRLTKAEDYLKLYDYQFMEAKSQTKYSFKSFVPISHGCDNFCSYCIVPFVRGREIHRNHLDIINNVNKLINTGIQEIILLGQNVNSYNDGHMNFPELLNEIAVLTGINRLGLMTSHPKDFSIDLVEVIKANKNIMRNIHLPLQSGNNRILNLMNRKYSIDEYLEKINIAREIDDIIFTTDILIGFPGETEQEFNETLQVLDKVMFYEAFTYKYNSRPGTKAEYMQNQISENIKKDRLSRMIERQKINTGKVLSSRIGKKQIAMLDSVSKKKTNELSGKSHNGINVFIEGRKELIGSIFKIEFISISGNGLTAKILNR